MRVCRRHPYRYNERAFAAAVSPADPFVDFFLKLAVLQFVFVRCPDTGVQALIPPTLKKQSLFGLTTEILFLDEKLTIAVAALVILAGAPPGTPSRQRSTAFRTTR